MDQSKMKIAYVVTQRGTNKYWTRIGVAFVNKDGSMNVHLDVLPLDGKLHVREPGEKRESPGNPGNNGTHHFNNEAAEAAAMGVQP